MIAADILDKYSVNYSKLYILYNIVKSIVFNVHSKIRVTDTFMSDIFVSDTFATPNNSNPFVTRKLFSKFSDESSRII